MADYRQLLTDDSVKAARGVLAEGAFARKVLAAIVQYNGGEMFVTYESLGAAGLDSLAFDAGDDGIRLVVAKRFASGGAPEAATP